MILIIPFGAASGYGSVTLAYQLKEAGASVGEVAALVALGVLPQTWKFFWAPVVDLTLSQKKWYLIAGLLTAVGIGSMGFFPATKAGLSALSAIVFVTSLASTFLGMAVESLLAHSTPQELKGRAGGWFQAGSLGGSGIGGGLGLLLFNRLHSPGAASCIVGGLCFLCSFALIGVPASTRPAGGLSVLTSITVTLKDVWGVVRRRKGALALVLCILPIGSGAAPFSAVATEWQASAETVALVTGLLGGLISAVGCLAGGWLCDRMNRQHAYVCFGLLQAASAVAMALLPRNEPMFIYWVSVYNFANGLAYAAFTAFVLEAIGKGAAATKYNAMASLANLPIYYMTNVDGWAHDHWNSSGMLYTEAGLALAAGLGFLLTAKILMRNNSETAGNAANQPAA